MQADIIEQVTEIATKTAIEKFEELKKQEQKHKADHRLHNTKRLLKNYKRLKIYCENIKDVEQDDVADPLEKMMIEKISLESITRSTARTLKLMRFIDNMLHVYKMNCEQSEKPEHARQYQTLYHFYLAGEHKTYAQIAEITNVHERTAQRDLQEAVHTLSVYFFGADGLRIQL